MAYSWLILNILFGICHIWHRVQAFHNGAPCSTQYAMTPSTIFHGIPQNPASKPPPFEFKITDLHGNPVTKYKDQVYKIRLSGVQASFRGFLIQARPASDQGYPIGHSRVGQFVADSSWQAQGIKSQPCPGVFNDSLTHATNDDRQVMQVKWRPLKNHGPILFILTVVENRTLFWTQWLPSAGFLVPEEGAIFSGDKMASKTAVESEDQENTGSEATEGPSQDKEPISATKSPHSGKVHIEIEATEEPSDEEPITPSPKGHHKKKSTTSAPVESTTELETTQESTEPSTVSQGKGKKKSTTAPETTELVETTQSTVNAKKTTTVSVETTETTESIEPNQPSTKGKSKKTTTQSVDEETTQLVSTTESAPEPSKSKNKARPEKLPEDLPNTSDHSDRLPPAPAAAAVSVDETDNIEDSKTTTGRPSTKWKKPTDSSDVDVSITKSESTTAASTSDEFVPPPVPAPVSPSSGQSKNPKKPDVQEPPPAQFPAAAPSLFEESDTTDYCAERPCQNNGTCVNVPEDERYECKCPKKWAGLQCTEPNKCIGHKCKNGAECVNAEDKYICKCAKEWAGEFCNKSCPTYLCENGGTCIVADDQYGCICAPGWTGPRCHLEIKHCDSQPCQNGGTCVHKFNAFECKCKDGFMGEVCHRPCQDVYRSCDFWGEQDKCETQRAATKWFDTNCAFTCGLCKFENKTVTLNVTLPPVLESFQWILGKWTLNSTDKNHFPIDFLVDNSAGYIEELIFSVAEVPQFGPPSINVSSVAINNLNPDDRMVSVGFLTVRPATIPLRTFLMTTGNDGITVVEEGITNDTLITLTAQYFAILPWVDDKAPATAKRSFSIANSYLKMDIERTTNSGQKDYFTKYYLQKEKYAAF